MNTNTLLKAAAFGGLAWLIFRPKEASAAPVVPQFPGAEPPPQPTVPQFPPADPTPAPPQSPPPAPGLLVSIGYTAGPNTTRNFQRDWNRVVNHIKSYPFLAQAFGFAGVPLNTLSVDNIYGPKSKAAADFVKTRFGPGNVTGNTYQDWFTAVDTAKSAGASSSP
ncbi:MAG: hypothetical protein V3V20_02900 [Algisphaera sp.]